MQLDCSFRVLMEFQDLYGNNASEEFRVLKNMLATPIEDSFRIVYAEQFYSTYDWVFT